MELALTGGTVVASLDPPRLSSADVLVGHGRILSLGRAPEGVARRDCTGCLIVPGNVCAHTHLYSALARGMPFGLEPPENFLQILQRIWWRLDRALDEESIRASALIGGIDALRSGTTTLIDHHASPNAIDGSLDVIADALEELGIRSVLCYEVSDRDGPAPARAGLRENERFLSTRRSLTGGQVGVHASFTVSEETLAACADLSSRTGAGVHIHVAEDDADQRDARARFATSVVHRLASAGVLTEAALLAHCVHLDRSEVELVRDSGAGVAHNPTSNMNNGVGHAPALALGERVALGTDGIGADMFAESRAAYVRARDEDVTTPIDWPLVRLAEGARLAGRLLQEPALGRLEPGAPADLCVLEYPGVTPISEENLGGHVLFGIGARHVRDVLVGGELVVSDRRLTRIDEDRVAAEASAVAARLWRRVAETGPHGFEPAGGAAA